MTHNRGIDDEDIGIRSYQSRKAKAVEMALGRIRRGVGDSWTTFTSEETEELGWVLGELWTYVTHTAWEELHFGLLSADELRHVIALGRSMRGHARPAAEVLEEIDSLVKSKG